MPEILIFFLGSLAASAAVGVGFYYALGPSSEAAIRRVLGPRLAPMWGRTFRVLVLLMALTGGLSTQWYGCEGYADYAAVAADRRLMVEKSTTQVASAISYSRSFVVMAAGAGAIVVALLGVRGSDEERRS